MRLATLHKPVSSLKRFSRIVRHLHATPVANSALDGHYAQLQRDGGITGQQTKWAFAGESPSHSEEGMAVATFAAGCFWGPQLLFERIEGVIATSVGYTQGKVLAPDYNNICSGTSGRPAPSV